MKKIRILACIAFAFVSCSKSETVTNSRAITVTSTIDEVTTKAVVGSASELTNITFVRADDALSDLTIVDFSSTPSITGSRAPGSNSAILFSPNALTYDMTANKYAYLRGYHPAGTLSSGVVTWTPDGATDVLMTDVWNAGRYTAPVSAGMVFKHILARIEVICKADANDAHALVQETWGAIESIKFVGAQPRMKYTYETNTLVADGAATDFPLLNSNTYTGVFAQTAIPASNSSTVTASAMIVPTGESTITLKVKAVKQVEQTIGPITLLANGTFGAGKVHIITLTFKAGDTDIEVTDLTVTDWTRQNINVEY